MRKKFKIDMEPILNIGNKSTLDNSEEQRYFKQARSWSDEVYNVVVLQRNRWRFASIFVCLPVILLLLYWVSILIPSQHIEPLLVHHYEGGFVSVEPMKDNLNDVSWSQSASNIVRYVTNRMAFDSKVYSEQYKLTILLSDSKVAKEYLQEQKGTRKDSPVNKLGKKYYRTVHIETVIPINSKTENSNSNGIDSENLAKVDFTITDHNRETGSMKTTPYSALISWDYSEKPNNIEDSWRNWDGFKVTSFTIQERNI